MVLRAITIFSARKEFNLNTIDFMEN
jgi:hypothetical protein